MASGSRKTVLVTGCSPGGIGEALAIEFRDQGFRVFATGRSADKLSHLGAKGFEAFLLDVTRDEDVREAAARVAELTGGQLDVLVNNAGRSYTVPAIDIDVEEVKRLFDTNLYGPMRMVKHFAPLVIAAEGKIVNIGSVGGVLPLGFGSAYNATKGALHAYSDTLRIELAPFGVDVITIISAAVQSHIADNETRSLPKDSVYHVMKDEIHTKRYGMSQRTGSWPADKFAQELVNAVIGGPKEPTLWLGHKIWAVRLLSWLPRRRSDVFMSKLVGLDTLENINRKQREAS